MSQGPRVLRLERGQLRWEMVDLDSQLPPEHRARLVWSFVAGLDLADFYARIKARDDTAGRLASDPAVLPGGMAVCDAGRDRRGAGDRTSVRASCGVSLAVRRRAGEPR